MQVNGKESFTIYVILHPEYRSDAGIHTHRHCEE